MKNTRPVTEWAERIRGVWQDNVASIFEVGNLLVMAREELGAVAFAEMVREELKYSKGTVSKLMIIARDQKLVRVSHAILPCSWMTLYALAKLTADEFDAGLASGAIHPGMERKDVKALKPEPPKAAKPPDPSRATVDDWCGKFSIQISLAAATLPKADRAELFEHLKQAINELMRDVDV